MHRLQRLFGGMLAGLLLSLTAMAQDKTEPESQPVVPRGFRMYLVADGRFNLKDEKYRIGKLHDPVTEYGLKMVLAVFVRGVPAKDEAKGDDPAVVVMRKQQELATRWRIRRLCAFTTFLALKKDFAADDDRDARITEINTLAKGANVPLVSVGLAEATLEGDVVAPQVEAWGIAPDDAITIVLYHRFKIVKRWRFKADALPTDKDLEEVADEVKALMSRTKD